MFIYCILSLFFLIWTFYVATTMHSLMKLGELRSLEIIAKNRRSFFYFIFHRYLFKKKAYPLFLSAAQLGENFGLMGCAATAIACLFVHISFSWVIHLVGLIVLLILVLLIGEGFPRLWASYAPEKSLKTSAIGASFFLFLISPISIPFLKLIKWSAKTHAEDSVEETKETILQILRDLEVTEKLDHSDKKLLESVIKFKDRIVREVMVPRVDLFSLSADTTIREAAQKLVAEGYSRTPVYRDTLDNIIGVLMFKDVLEIYMDCAEGKQNLHRLEEPISTIAKKVFYVPEIKKVSQLLQEFRAKHMHMAIVVDEYGGTEGVVTLEDLLEEIVGDIADEYDIQESSYAKLGEGCWIADARMSILDAESLFGIEVDQEGDYDTLGGYIFHKLGKIPVKGEKIEHDTFKIDIVSSSERNIEKVKITLLHKKED